MLKAAALVLACVTMLSGFAVNFPSEELYGLTSEYTELGIPSDDRYTSGIRARCVWDMAYYDGKVYTSNGDFDTNAGPIDIWAYDTASSEWELSGSLPDEEINRFAVIGDTLAAPGIDPRGVVSAGNYYKLSDGKWETFSVIPSATHTFDLLEHDGLIFAGLGVAPGKYPIAVSKDGGESFTPVRMSKNGRNVDTSAGSVVRVYDLFTVNDTVYAIFRYVENGKKSFDLYRYANGVFVFEDEWYDKLRVSRYMSGFIGADAVYKDKLYLTTGYLFVTEDMRNISEVTIADNTNVYDLCVYNDRLYALCSKDNGDGTYRVSVWENTSGEADGFEEILYFDYDAPAMCMLHVDGTVYLGIGDYNNVNDKNGMVLSVKLK